MVKEADPFDIPFPPSAPVNVVVEPCQGDPRAYGYPVEVCMLSRQHEGYLKGVLVPQHVLVQELCVAI